MGGQPAIRDLPGKLQLEHVLEVTTRAEPPLAHHLGPGRTAFRPPGVHETGLGKVASPPQHPGAGLAYLFPRRHAQDSRFSLGTGKFGELAAFSSAIILGMIALGVAYESLLRLLHPVAIHFQEAIPIAALGLCVNLVSAWLLRDQHHHAHHNHHDHGHDHHHKHDLSDHEHGAHHRDINLRAAYVHVLADALISIMAIAGLSVAWAFGWIFMDPLVGLVGALVIASWALSLLRAAGCVLLDTVPDPGLAQRIRTRMEL